MAITGNIWRETELRTNFLQALDGSPQTFADEGFCAEAFDEVERHVELIAADGAEVHGCVAAGEEYDCEGGDEEIVEADLLDAVDVGCLVEVGKGADGVFGELNHSTGVGGVLLD